MLKVLNLVKTYQTGKSKKKNLVKALNNVSIEFPEKGLIFLLGKSGSGKSTLLNSIGGLDTFDSGEIIIKGKSSKDFSQSDFDSYRNTFIGFIFQEYNILENFSVAKNIALALELQGKKATKEEVNGLLEKVDLLEYAKRKPNQLSGGQKQRVAIARALIKNPEIIMADEPTGALDSSTGKQVMETLKKLSKEKLVIIVSHDRDFAEHYGDRIVELKDGKIISDTTKKEIAAKKTLSGISVVEGKYIHIKKDQKLSDHDVAVIVSRLKQNLSKGETVITLDEKSNSEVKKIEGISQNGNQNAFINTEPEDIKSKEYLNKDLKLIKSKLKQKDAFKMGASALKYKVVKLIFTIFLSVVAFAGFGIIHAFASWNRPDSDANALQMSNVSTVFMKKSYKTKWGSSYEEISNSDFEKVKEENSDYVFFGVAGEIYGYQSLYVNGYSTYTDSVNPYKNLYVSGLMNITLSDIEKLGFTLEGRLPTSSNEVCISKHSYELIKSKNPSITTWSDITVSTYDLIGTSNVVGVIDDKTDFSDLENISDEKLQNDYQQQSLIQQRLSNSFAWMVYVDNFTFNDKVNTNSGYAGMVVLLKKNSEDVKLIKSFENYDKNGERYLVQNSITRILDSLESTIKTLTTYIIWVAVAFAFFASFLLMNFISTSISYKKREIGVLRALGARGIDVFKIFFNESFIISFINFVIASFATFITCFFINRAIVRGLSVPIVLLNMTFIQVILIFTVSVASAFIASVLPVTKISKKKPIDAINNR